jgi:trans-aconitate methyltransferase
MSTASSHLGIELAEYDARIRTFIPDYERMLRVGASAVPRGARAIVDLGTGTGALAARCLRRAPAARLVGIDADAGMLSVAARRMGRRASFVTGNFLRTPLPRCDVVVASFALHHVRTRTAKQRLYGRTLAALTPGGMLISVDCYPSPDGAAARRQRDAWLAHLRRSYTPREAEGFLRAWSTEDVYVPLDDERAMLERAGFRVDVLWRRESFAVLRARRGRS